MSFCRCLATGGKHNGGGQAHDVTKCQEREANACGIVLTTVQPLLRKVCTAQEVACEF